ncbi:disease resistance protein RPS6-like [Cucurbita moschata]|uniref:Disease resistance protein RPS6-like n=1 Tax=Cucurbita moschata TaxID=3662 RepID=A0A6J1G497_CUCMO|nr:disease resistance protein RPS6-like [Cucurbita moschata]
MEELSPLFSNFECSYDVFLSFRGEDTRSSFISHLDMALRQKGVNVFIDDKLNRGEKISESLFRSIEGALISIVIFSENYASSSWCLDELVKIIECKKCKGQIVWPIFYKVDPLDIRKQTGSFGEALVTHQAKFEKKIQIWREALTNAANLSGWDLGTRKEAELIQDIVKKVLSILNRTCTPLYTGKYLVGIKSQLENMRFHSHYWTQHEPSNGVYMVGIYGIGGIGKTTLAKALYNKIAYQFEAGCFLSKVREASKQFNGLVQLQEHLLHEILKEDLKVGNLYRGINIIRNRLRSKKVLIALDDVDKLEQLEALVGGRDWFGPGTKIIVTTIAKRLLSIHEFDQMYGIRGMNHDDALKLFSWHAFKKSHPPSDYSDLSERATSYCKGHPLALVVLGSFLYKRNDQTKWRSILDEFENSLKIGIKDILQKSFDELEEKMGHTIINSESSKPGKRSRLWLKEDVLKVFMDNSGTDAVRGIKLDLPNPKSLDVDPRAFKNMKNLELLMVRNASFFTNLEYLPPNLKWITWHGFTQKSLPSCFITKNLVGLSLPHSLIRNFEKGFTDCKRLKLIDLSYSASLEEIPDFSASSSMEELYLSHCTILRIIPTTVASLGKLITLDLNHCSNLKKLPSYFMLKSLKVLNLSYCNKLEELPDFSAVSSLETLYLNNCTNLRVIHESIGSLDSLIKLDFRGCTKLEMLPSYLELKSLKYLYLSGCCKLEMFPEIAENMKSLVRLDLSFTAIKELPSSIRYLTALFDLDLHGCTNLISIPNTIYLLHNLRELSLGGCSRFEMLPLTWDSTIHPTCSSSNHGNFVEFRISSFSSFKREPMFYEHHYLVLENCTISNTDFLKALCEVTPFLSSLFLSGNKFSCLPKFLSLKNLRIRNDMFLQEIPNLPMCIQELDAIGCESLAKSRDNVDDIILNKQRGRTRMGLVNRQRLQRRRLVDIVY